MNFLTPEFAVGILAIAGFITVIIVAFLEIGRAPIAPMARLAWCAIVFFIPFLGVLAWFIFGARTPRSAGLQTH
ncbi:cardiolipin synthase [Cryobacterium flavum]|uniref:Cardiolipin synthase n=1 Tax=Cryobacterium flavum TaxID=1424659 RepID=A0A4V3I801_9MICO|nr:MULTISPECIES: PLDc N-terminal domain-containing protein [Cryobacterium]TFB71920.1 hypothetical protein E3O21_19655 [Cryobacterium flavum]SDO63804.1 cardiolipin synthase [Cryobacterium flavum]